MWLLNLCVYVATVMYNYRNMYVKVAFDNKGRYDEHDDDDDDYEDNDAIMQSSPTVVVCHRNSPFR